jgi:hypothetical protein
VSKVQPVKPHELRVAGDVRKQEQCPLSHIRPEFKTSALGCALQEIGLALDAREGERESGRCAHATIYCASALGFGPLKVDE